jgi:integrase/recombinase XerD
MLHKKYYVALSMNENEVVKIDQNLVEVSENLKEVKSDELVFKNSVSQNTRLENIVSNNYSSNPIPIQATNDEQIIEMWLYGKSQTTQSAYYYDVTQFLELVNKPIRQIILLDLHKYGQFLVEKNLKERSQQRKLACIKSLLSFATKVGYLSFDVGKVLKLPKYKDDLANRILDESTIIKIIYSTKNLRNHLFLKASYLLGARVSEVINLTWDDFSPSGEHVGVTLYGKGGKTRTILITNSFYEELLQLKAKNTMYPTRFVFISKKTKDRLSRMQAFRTVQKAVILAGLDQNISPHWFRHAHASHALAKGAPMPLIQRDLGHSSLAITGRYLHVKPTDGSGLWLSV